MSLLLPEGIDHLGDCPYTLHAAIVHALRILGYEEFPSDERPPRRIWLDGEKLTEHWKRIEAARNEKYGITDEDGNSSTYENNAVELVKRG